MAQVRGTFTALYDGVDKMVYTVLKSQLKELEDPSKGVLNVKTSSKKFERVQTVTPFGNVPEKPEGEVYALDLIRPGYSKDFTHLEFGLGFEVTQTAQEDDEYDVISRSSEWLAFVARYTQGTYAARMFNNGFTTETTPDALSLFNTAHVLKGGGTARNRPSTDADLSAKALMDALADVQTQTKLESGQLVSPVMEWILYVPPALEFLAHRIVGSNLMPESADNDLNPIKSTRRITVKVNPHLSDEDAWFLVAKNPKLHGLTKYVRKGISMDSPATDPYTGNRIYKVRYRESYGAWMWQNVYGTTGA